MPTVFKGNESRNNNEITDWTLGNSVLFILRFRIDTINCAHFIKLLHGLLRWIERFLREWKRIFRFFGLYADAIHLHLLGKK